MEEGRAGGVLDGRGERRMAGVVKLAGDGERGADDPCAVGGDGGGSREGRSLVSRLA